MADRLVRAIDVQFEPGQAVIPPYSLYALDSIAEVLARYPGLRLEITGYADASGSAASNQRLSEERASAVRTYLMVRHGILPERLVATGYGETMPIASNADPGGRALNRRVTFRITEPVAEQNAPTESSADNTRRPLNVDSLRDVIERQVAEAMQDKAPGAAAAEDSAAMAEERLEQRLRNLEDRLREESEVGSSRARPATPRPFALLPFTGFYLRNDVPVLLGIRADIETSLVGSAHFQPEGAIAFTPDDYRILANANLVFPLQLQSGIKPFVGFGGGITDFGGFEAVLNILAGTEYRFGFGVLFAEVMTQDFFDFNRVVVGFRQEW